MQMTIRARPVSSTCLAPGTRVTPTTTMRTMDLTSSPESVKARMGRIQSCLKSLGFPDEHLRLLRLGTHWVFAADASGLVIRVLADGEDPSAVRVHNSHLIELARQGARLVLPLEEEPRQLGDDFWITLWPYCPQQPFDMAREMVGALLSLHSCQDPGLGLWNPGPRILQRLVRAEAQGVPSNLLVRLVNLTEPLLDERPTANHSAVPVHGDAHAGNLVSSAGKGLLIDLDDVSLGPREVDLAPAIVSLRRFPRSRLSGMAVLNEYSYEELTEPLLEWCVRVREVNMISWLSTLWSTRPETRTELVHRLDSIDTNEPWTAI